MSYELKEFDLSALMELGNIGASHAAIALSKIIYEKVELTSPSMTNIEELKENIDSSPIACTYSTLLGGVKAFLLFVFPEEQAISLSNLILKTNIERKGISELEGPPLQKITKAMVSSFTKALEEFFGKKTFFTVPLYVYGKFNVLEELLGRDAIFFCIEFKIKGEKGCNLILSLTKDDITKIMETEVPEFEEFGTFGEMLGTFDKLLEIENRIEGLIQNKVPYKEIKSFLRAVDEEVFENNPLKKYLEEALVFVGIGEKIAIKRREPLRYEVIVESCNICKDLPDNNKKSCFTTNTALGRFFRENLDIGNEVIETHCIKTDDYACVHLIILEQIDVLSYLYEERDIKILKFLTENPLNFDEILKLTELSKEEIESSIKVLKYYNLIDKQEEKFEITELGKVFLTFAENAPEKSPVEYDENWNDVSKIEELKDTPIFEEEKAPWELNEQTK